MQVGANIVVDEINLGVGASSNENYQQIQLLGENLFVGANNEYILKEKILGIVQMASPSEKEHSDAKFVVQNYAEVVVPVNGTKKMYLNSSWF